MLAPAEILQMEEYETPRSPSGSWLFGIARTLLPNQQLGVFGVSIRLVGAALILIGAYFTTHAIYIQAKAVVAQVLLERAWASTLATGQPVKAWAWADTWPVARISFPRLKESAIVLEDAGGEALAFGPAHVAGTPKLGAKGTSIVGGHRDTHFTFIKDLKPGDTIDVETPDGKTARYKMTGSTIVHARASGIVTAGSKPRLALVTCFPFDGLQRGPLRYVVFAEVDNVSPALASTD